MTATELHQFLQKIPEKSFDNAKEFEHEIISNFVKALDYKDENLFFEHVYVETGHILFQSDAIVGKNRINRPWLLLETKYRTNPPENDPKFVRNLFSKIFAIGNPEFLIILSNWKIWYGRNEDTIESYEFKKMEKSDAKEIYSNLKPPKSLPYEMYINQELEIEEPFIEANHFQLNLMEFQTKLKKMKAASTTKEKKETLEKLADFLLKGIKDIKVRERNLENRSSEIDLVAEYQGSNDYTIFDDYERFILVECKNWRKSVGAKQIRDFVKKMQNTKTNLGIIFAKNGISGADKGSYALREIDLAFHNHEISIVVFNENDLKNILKGMDFYDLLDKKLFNLRFSK